MLRLNACRKQASIGRKSKRIRKKRFCTSTGASSDKGQSNLSDIASHFVEKRWEGDAEKMCLGNNTHKLFLTLAHSKLTFVSFTLSNDGRILLVNGGSLRA